ncbi:MAG: TolC family protein [Saprospiraceae bacterium]|nr:TolC family protein [Saprospiraceae bacterium]
MNRITHILIIFTIALSVVNAQHSYLDQYVVEALQSNIALQQKQLSYQKSLAALKEAKGNYFPSLSLNARFSFAQGGRTIDFPIGDLMNPVYNNLNLLNDVSEASIPDYPTIPEYPAVENQSVNFLRTTEQETFVRVAMPIFNSAIMHGHRIRENLAEAEQISVEVYKKELVKEVKIGYFNFAKAKEAVLIFESTLDLVKENLRTTQSLHRNNKVTIDQVYAAEAEVKSIEQQLAEAQKNEKVAKAYFNFLLNKDYDAEIQLLTEEQLPKTAIAVGQARNQAFQQRAEFQQLNYAIAASDQNVKLSKSNFLPELALAVDYGVQGVNYNLDKDADYMLGSVLMNWNLFDWTTKAKTQQAQIEKEELFKRKEATKQQIGLQVVSAFYALEAATKSIDLAKAEEDAAQKAFKLVQKKYSQGQANLVEWTNARTQKTTAEQKQNIAKYEYQICLAEFERAMGE